MCDELIAVTNPMNTIVTTIIAKHHKKISFMVKNNMVKKRTKSKAIVNTITIKKRTNLVNNILRKNLCNVVVCNYLKAFKFCEIVSTKQKGPLHNDGGPLNPKPLNLQVL
jgi:hypothetical protein